MGNRKPNYRTPTDEYLNSIPRRASIIPTSSDFKVNLGKLDVVAKAIEEILLETGRWALFSVRVPGYFPASLCVSEGQHTLKLRLWSLATGYTFVIGLLSVAGSMCLIKSYYELVLLATEAELARYENTMAIIWTTMVLLVVYTTYLRCSRIYYARGGLYFWKQIVHLLETLDQHGYHTQHSLLRIISKKLLHWTLMYQIGALVRIIYNAYSLYIELNDPASTELTRSATVLDFFIGFTLCYHVGYSMWLTFQIALFRYAFELLHQDLDSIPEHGKLYFDGSSTTCNMSSSQTRTTGKDFAGFKSFFGTMDAFENGHKRSPSDNGILPSDLAKELEFAIRRTLVNYKLIEEVMIEFNAKFGHTLILEIFFIFVYILTSSYCVESYFKEDVWYAAAQIIPVVIYVSAIFHLASESSILSGRATGTLKKLEKFFVPTERLQLQSLQLRVLSLIARVADNPPTISAGHFFTINHRLLTSFTGLICTYLIVLFQIRKTGVLEAPTNTTTTIEA